MRTITEYVTPAGADHSVEVYAYTVANDFTHGGFRAKYAIEIGGRVIDLVIRKDVHQPRTGEWMVMNADGTKVLSYHGALRAAITAAGTAHFKAAAKAATGARKDLAYGPFDTMGDAYGFALTASTQDVVLGQGDGGTWWAGCYDTEQARTVAGRLMAAGMVTVIVANTTKEG